MPLENPVLIVETMAEKEKAQREDENDDDAQNFKFTLQKDDLYTVSSNNRLFRVLFSDSSHFISSYRSSNNLVV